MIKNIAILGATSHIAKGLISNFLQREEFALHLFTQSPQKVHNFLNTIEKSSDSCCAVYEDYQIFTLSSYDVIINCIGVGTSNKLRGHYENWFLVAEKYDNMVIATLRNNCHDALYISFSSGAVYGRDLSAPAEENTVHPIKVNHIAPQDYYAIARLNAEAKHRSLSTLNIVDLRLFSYFSRFIDMTDAYFITEVLNCIAHNEVFVTDREDMVRDYVHPYDLFSMIQKCMVVGRINSAYDVMSAKPAEKWEILEYFSSAYGLRYEIRDAFTAASATGAKKIYCSQYNKAAEIGYKPEYSSLDAIRQESSYILTRPEHRRENAP